MTWSCRKPLLCVSECVWKLQKSIIQLDSVVEVADIVGNDEVNVAFEFSPHTIQQRLTVDTG